MLQYDRWIESKITQFKDPNLGWARRERNLRAEIERYRIVSKDLELDPLGRAYTGLYLCALVDTMQQLRSELITEYL
jgi:hypothetical protein